jgi:hypothetical protein
MRFAQAEGSIRPTFDIARSQMTFYTRPARRVVNSTVAVQPVVTNIGGLSIALFGDDPAFVQVLQKRYAGFVNPTDDFQFRINIELVEQTTKFEHSQDLKVEREAGLWTFRRGDFRAEWNPGTGIGKILQSVNPYSADAVLRIVHTLILARQGGFLLHAASAVRDGRAFIFSGVSGAGKTTISRLAPPDATLLTDEISYIRPDGNGYRAFGTPFAGELATLGENVSAPLSTLFFLEKGKENRVETISRDQAMRALLRNVLFFAEDAELVNLVFQSACNFVERVPIRKLVFAPDQRVWETICSENRPPR